MRKKPDRTRRVARERKRLTCVTCGVGNQLAPRVADLGFQRCRHCRSAIPIEGAGAFAFDGQGFTHVISPGRSLFVLLYCRLFSLPGWLVFLLLGEFAATILQRILGRSFGLGLVSWIPMGIFVTAAVVLFMMLCVQQRILLVNNRLEASWHLFGMRIGSRRFGTCGLKMHVREKWPFGLRVQPRNGRPAWIGTDDVAEGKALKGEIEIAVDETRQPVGTDRIPCPGCGAPVATRLEVVSRRGVECIHCGSGIVSVKGGVVLGACSIRHNIDTKIRRPRPRRHLGPDGTVWQLASELSLNPAKALGFWSVGLLLGGFALIMGVGITLLVEDWRSFGLIFAMMFVPLGLVILYYFTVWFFGSHRMVLDETVLKHDLCLGALRVRRRIIPLPRLLSLQANETPAIVELKMKTATNTIDIHLPDRNGEGAAVALDVVTAMENGVRALEREVMQESVSAAGAQGRQGLSGEVSRESVAVGGGRLVE